MANATIKNTPTINLSLSPDEAARLLAALSPVYCLGSDIEDVLHDAVLDACAQNGWAAHGENGLLDRYSHKTDDENDIIVIHEDTEVTADAVGPWSP